MAADGSRQNVGRRSMHGWGRSRSEIGQYQPLAFGRGFFAPSASPSRRLFRKILLSLIGLGVIGFAVSLGTAASFVARATNAGSSFSSGTLLMSNSGTSPCSGVASNSNCGTLNLSSNTGMAPGSVATGSITITNAGTLPATMTLSTANATSNSLSALANLSIYDSTTSTCVRGTVSGAAVTTSPTKGNGSCDSLSGLTSQTAGDAFANVGPITLPPSSGSSWAVNESHSFTVTLELANSGSVPSGTSISVDFQWSGTQT